MRLRPEEIQVGDVFKADVSSKPWTVTRVLDFDVWIKSEGGSTLAVGKSFVAGYNFVHSGKYSNLLPYHDRS